MVSFRGIRFDIATRRVWRGDREIQLTRKAFDLLALLLEHRPKAVSKEDIHARLWPGTFVSEVTLHSLVSEVRRALGDRAGNPLFIRTVHGYGYAFVSPVAERRLSETSSRRICGWLVGAEGRFSLFEGQNVVGRGVPDVIELPSDTVSRHHANIRLDGDAWVEDLGSKNGTYVADQRITQPVRLQDGDAVRFGGVLMTFRLCRAGGGESTQSWPEAAAERR